MVFSDVSMVFSVVSLRTHTIMVFHPLRGTDGPVRKLAVTVPTDSVMRLLTEGDLC